MPCCFHSSCLASSCVTSCDMSSHAHTSNFTTEPLSGTFTSSALGGFLFKLVSSPELCYMIFSLDPIFIYKLTLYLLTWKI
jgi:hypothetical protein